MSNQLVVTEQPIPVSSNKFDGHGKSLADRASSSPSTTEDLNFESYAEIFNEPREITWEELSNLVWHLNPSKEKAQHLALRLKQWNFLSSQTRVCAYRSEQSNIKQFFKK